MNDARHPPILYRHVDEHKAVDAHLAGDLWLRTFRYFRKTECQIRRDEQEGIGSGITKDGYHITVCTEDYPIRPTFILCFTECQSAQKFGKCTLRLRDGNILQRKVHESMGDIKVHTCLLPVKYSNEPYEKCPTPTQLFDRMELTKPTRFRDEKEWRLIVRLPLCKIRNDTLELSIGDEDNIFELEHDCLGIET